ncbi:hypothetical protein B9479_002049 [Cryptococcus floricola]|uniref:Uncharacterized protein n=1 Tax=Cryptococcus floricola TaxID=2591691 RepID=A0A5D3B4V8_9TREE|nr:hypothetical protein B9479_002049 [Cryptococcus floricola]
MSVPPLPPPILARLLPHLLPPAPLPQDILSKTFLQRLAYLPPPPDDLDAHLSPFPSTPDQPVSSRLRELTRGHQWGKTEYTREGPDIYARLVVEKEHGGDGVEVWFEHEPDAPGTLGRGWVYQSARIPSVTDHAWVSDISSLPPPLSESLDTTPTEATDDPTTAPSDYWAGFDDDEPTEGPHVAFDLPDGQAEDAYWAQYSRPATAPMTPGPRTPGTPGLYHAHSEPNPHSLPHPAQAYFGQQPKAKAAGEEVDERAVKLAESLIGLAAHNGGLTGISSLSLEPKGIWKETGEDVKARVKGKIGSGLNNLWKEFTAGAEGEDKEEKAMEWLRIARSVCDPASPVALSSGTGTDRAIAKLEVLKDMYEVLNEEEEAQGFWRMLEGVIRRSEVVEEDDELTRQQMYYE